MIFTNVLMCTVHTKILKRGTDLGLCLGFIEAKIFVVVFINNDIVY